MEVGDVVRIHDLDDYTWLGVITEGGEKSGYFPGVPVMIYTCDVWRIEDGAIVQRSGVTFHGGQLTLVVAARDQAVGR